MQHYNVTDGKGMPPVICRVVYVDFLINRFKFLLLRLSVYVGKLPRLDKVIFSRLDFHSLRNIFSMVTRSFSECCCHHTPEVV